MGQLITIGKRHWLAGMSWASYETLPRKEELREDAVRLTQSPRWFALRNGDEAIQAGFSEADLNPRHVNKINSLAAMLADSKVQPWYGYFQIAEDMFWYIAVRDGNAILPDGDVIGSRADVDAARQRHATFTDWNVVEGDLALVESMLQNSDCKPTPLRSLYPHKALVSDMIARGVLLIVVVAGFWWWHLHDLETESARSQLQQQMDAQQTEKPAPTVEEILAAMPQPSQWLSACHDALYPIALSNQGWQLDHVDCHATSAIAHWKRGDGATVAQRPEGVLLNDDNAVDQSIPLKWSENHINEKIVSLTMAQQVLRAWTQARGLPLTMAQTGTKPLLPGAKPDKSAIALPVNNLSVTIDMPSPFASGAEFDAIPGLRLISMQSRPEGIWTVQGVIYGR